MRRSPRTGFALFVSILAVVMVGALIVAVHVSVSLDRAVAEGSVYGQRAFAAAEYALWSEVAAWDSSRSALAPGAVLTRVLLVGADSVVLTIARRSAAHYWLASSATAGVAPRTATRGAVLSVHVSRDTLGRYLARPLAPYGWVPLR